LGSATGFHHLSNEPPSTDMDRETDGVVPNRLCGSCARIVKRSRLIQEFIVTDFRGRRDRIRRNCPTGKEIFFHSPRLKTFMSSVASGCHLCSLVSWDESKYFRHKGQSGIASALEHSNAFLRLHHAQAYHHLLGQSRRLLLSGFHDATLSGRS
ncbi:hypothetical protein QBC32DRAFT_206667, partial [Pseudoneurospora amorphoporcata]